MDEELKQFLDIDYMEVLYEDDSVSIVDLLVMHEGLNRNRCDIPHDVIIEALPSLCNKPIWGIPNKTYLKEYSDDFVEHARNEEQENNILIFGVFPESGVKNAQFIEKDAKTYLKVQAILFKKYSIIAMNILKQRDGNCKISVEILAKGDTKNGILYVKDMVFLSATCLSKDIKEGIEGSSMEIVRFSLDEAIKESNEKYLSFTEEENKNSTKSDASDITDNDSVIEIDNSKEIINKEVESMEDNKKIEFSLNSTQIFEIFSNAINSIKYTNGDWECCKYWTEAYDESFVYLRDCEEGKTYKMPYILQDNIATIDFENKVCVISGGYVEVGENGETVDNLTEETIEETIENAKVEEEKGFSKEEMEAKYADLESKFADMENKFKMAEEEIVKYKAEIETYAREDEETKMMAMLEQFAHCMSDEEKVTMAKKIKESKFSDFEEMVNAKIKDFALKSKEDKKEEDTTKIDNSFKVSFSNFGLNEHYNYQKNDNADISIAEKYGIKIK